MFHYWLEFTALIVVMLGADLFAHRKAHHIHMKEALGWSVLWISVALVFNGWVWVELGSQKAMQFFTGYLIEKFLSVDNIFVFIMLFKFFKVPAAYQHRVLFWGVLGAIILRALLIGFGVVLIEKFTWILYVFGVFLLYTAYQMVASENKEFDKNNTLLRWCKAHLPMSRAFVKDQFVVRENKRLHFTPLFLVLLMVEFSDLVFAIDSIPAVFAITTEPFIVYTSNIFAILGLRALYFVLTEALQQVRYLNIGLSVILAFVGCKMLVASVYHFPAVVSLSIILGILVITCGASWYSQRQRRA